MYKKVNINAMTPIRTFTPAIDGVILNKTMSVGDIGKCLNARAYVDEIINSNTTLRLNSKNYNISNLPNQLPSFNGIQSSYSVITGQGFEPMYGVTATDPEDGDLTSSIIVDTSSLDLNKQGVYTVKYTVTDSAGDIVSVNSTVVVKDNTAPELRGILESINVNVGDIIDLLKGVSAYDEEDGDITDKIIVSGKNVYDTVGEYNVMYSITDSCDETVQSFTTIIVDKNEVPVFFGVTSMTIEANTSFDPMLNVTAIDTEDGDLTSSITVTGEVDTTTVGEYTLNYSVSDSEGQEVIAERIITVVEEAVVKFAGLSDSTIKLGDSFDPMSGVTATCPEDGDLTSSITVNGSYNVSEVGEYVLTYSVTNSLDRTTTKKITLTVRTNDAPVISGANNDVIIINSSFGKLNGVTAHDTEDGDLTSSIVVAGSVDVEIAGTYTLTYSVTDSHDNTTTVERNVTITDNKAVINGAVNSTIKVGDSFDPMSGVTATDTEDGDLTSDITVTGEVDTTTVGTYTLTYSVTDSGNNTTTKTINVTVENIEEEAVPTPNEAPVINGLIETTIKVGDSFDPMSGVTATDTEDGDLTSDITVTGEVDTTTVGEYTLTYSVMDTDANITTENRKVTVVNTNTEPVIIMEQDTVYFEEGYMWEEDGSNIIDAILLEDVTATDNEDGDLTSSIQMTYGDNWSEIFMIEEEVATCVVGETYVTLSVTDADNNEISVTRKVIVNADPTLENDQELESDVEEEIEE